jgi:hypothetical protein
MILTQEEKNSIKQKAVVYLENKIDRLSDLINAADPTKSELYYRSTQCLDKQKNILNNLK